MPTAVKRLSPVILLAALIALVAYLYRRQCVFPIYGHSRRVAPTLSRDRLWPRFRRSGPAVAVMSLLVILVLACPYPRPSDSPVSGRALAQSLVSSRGGFRIMDVAVLAATPQPVPVLSRPIGPPSPDPVLLAAARIALTPTPTPRPVTPLPGAGVAEWRRDVGVFRVTAYSDSPVLNGTDGRGITKSGVKTHWGCVAVDPSVIPLGTRLVIENFEGTVFTALDTGGGIRGRWVDIWFPTDDEALEHGLKELAVAIVEEDSR